MTIKSKINETLDTINNLMDQAIYEANNDNWYASGCATAAARDTCEALAERINGLACALSAEGYNNQPFADIVKSLRGMHNRLIIRVASIEKRLAT